MLFIFVAFGGGKAGQKEESFAITQRKEVPELLYKKKLPDFNLTAENFNRDNSTLRNGSKSKCPVGVV